MFIFSITIKDFLHLKKVKNIFILLYFVLPFPFYLWLKEPTIVYCWSNQSSLVVFHLILVFKYSIIQEERSRTKLRFSYQPDGCDCNCTLGHLQSNLSISPNYYWKLLALRKKKFSLNRKSCPVKFVLQGSTLCPVRQKY